ncbi:MAG: nicotinate phosphoribosyltransferase [Pyrinomonadaceae bacterium]
MAYTALPYGRSMALYTDLYELTMGQVYLASGMKDLEGAFYLSYRHNPFSGGYAIACGLEFAIDYLKNLRFDEEDIGYLASLAGNDGRALFSEEFLAYLRQMRFACDVDAVPEGTIVFPHEPLIRVTGPIIQAQLIETALLTFLNFQTLIATKAARICQAADGAPVLEFGARRAQGVDGAYSATRAAYIGGCAGTSNVWAAKHLGLPPSAVKGTMAHSLVMSFDTEPDAFAAYAEAMPNNSIYLVDTYGTLEGIRHAIDAGRKLRARGFELTGIRLDSGDLAALSKRARAMLDEAGFDGTQIIASNDLDERLIESLKRQGAPIAVWAVGTRLVTAYDDPALGGVYKLAAIRRPNGSWERKIKLSDQPIKVSNPGVLQLRRYHTDAKNIADAVYDIETDMSQGCTVVNPLDMTRQIKIPAATPYTDLLVPVFRGGELVYELPPLEEIRRNSLRELNRVAHGVKRFDYPDEYPAWLEKSLYTAKTNLILERRGIGKYEHEPAAG